MLRFARESGVDLPPELTQDIAALDELLQKLGLPPVSELPTDLLRTFPPPPSTGDAPKLSGTQLVLKVHGALSRIVAPATALTLHATEPAPGKNGVFARMPKIVKWAAGAAIASALGFVLSAALIAAKDAAEEAKKPDTTAHAPVTPPSTPGANVGGEQP
jgi:hypothetical protein